MILWWKALYTITVKCFILKEQELASSVGQDKTVEHQNASVKLWQSAGFFSSFCFKSELCSGKGHLNEAPVVFTLPRGASSPPHDSHMLWTLSWGRSSHLWALCLERRWIHIACAQDSISVPKGQLLSTDMSKKWIMENVVVESPFHSGLWSLCPRKMVSLPQLLILLFNQNCKLQKIYC